MKILIEVAIPEFVTKSSPSRNVVYATLLLLCFAILGLAGEYVVTLIIAYPEVSGKIWPVFLLIIAVVISLVSNRLMITICKGLDFVETCSLVCVAIILAIVGALVVYAAIAVSSWLTLFIIYASLMAAVFLISKPSRFATEAKE